ncbi:LOW QUALITY PROTEIN: hypothetical protein ACHAXR_009172 [Thalassiosira sp. AJA248-18]
MPDQSESSRFPVVAAAESPSSSQHLPAAVPSLGSSSASGPPSYSELIDNSTRRYSSVRLKCGVTVHVGEHVVGSCPGILEVLNNDLIGCLSVLPPSTRRLVRRTKIWVNRTYSYGPVINPKTVHHTTAHHFPGWLLWKFPDYGITISTLYALRSVRDNPKKEGSIEIYNAAEYQRLRHHYNGSGLILHELCHIIHQKVLPGGLSNAMVVEIHHIAKLSGKYSKVLRRDWALNDVDTDMAYCIVNHKEFFAEISVAFLADSYHHVDGTGSTTMATCSPPFVSPAVIERIQQQTAEGSQQTCTSKWRVMSITDTMVLPHCSKFFPFTKGQLRRYDPRVYKCFIKLWLFIEGWEDAEERRCYSCEWF